MRKKLLLVVAILLYGTSFGQLTGQKTIPGDYASIAVAINALNMAGVGANGVYFNILAGYVETLPSSTAGLITATGTALNPIVFKRTGSGANPVIYGYATAPGVTDYIICLQGSDYITFDGIDVSDPAGADEWGFAILKASGSDGSQNVTIQNCSVTLKKTNTATCGIYSNNHTPASTNQLTVTATSGQNSNNKFYGNTFTNCYNGIYINGFTDPSAPYTYYDQGNDIGSLAGNVFTNFGGGSSTCYQVYMAYQNGFMIANCNINGGSGTTGITYGIYGGIANNASGSIYGNVIQINTAGISANAGGIYNGLGNSGTTNTINIYNNTIQNCTQPGSTTSIFYGIYNYATALNINLYGNVVNNNVFGGSNSMYLCETTSVGGGGTNVHHNTVSNNQRSGIGTQSGSSYLYCLYITGNGNTSIHDNSVFGNSAPNQVLYGAFIYGIYCSNSAVTQMVYNNSVHDQSIGSAFTGAHSMYGIYSYPAPAGVANNALYNNTVYNLTINNTSSGYGYIYGIYGYYMGNIYSNSLYNVNIYSTSGYGYGYGIYFGGSGAFSVYKNKVYGVSMAGTSGYYFGMYITNPTTANVYNNYISDLKTPASISTNGLHGIYISSGTSVNLYYNTIFLNCISSSTTTFISDAVYSSINTAVEFRNNIFINTSTAPGSSTYSAAVYRRNNTTLTSYVSTSNNNNFYAGTPSVNNLIFTDGTNSFQTLETYKTWASPRDGSSVTELSPFMNIISTPYDLHLNTSISTKCESGGSTIVTPSITSDYDNEARYPNPGYPVNPSYPPNTPDIGADEFAGIPNDQTPPNISITPLGNINNGFDRILTALITDGTGVPASDAGLPVLYWKINNGSWNNVHAVSIGGSQYTFTFGAGTIQNDVVSYYIVAQDLQSPTPNVGSNPNGGAAGFTANPPACSTPPSTPYTYIYLGNIAGVFHVGVGKDFPTLTAAVNALQVKYMTGPVTFVLDDPTYPAETFPIVIYANPGNSLTNTLTIKPNFGVTPIITGYSTTGILNLNGMDYVTIDGSSSGGSDRSLTLENTHPNTTTYTIGLFNNGSDPSTNCTIKNCEIKASPQITNSTYGIFLNATGGGYENIVISNNHIYSARYGILFAGTSDNKANNGQIINNTIGSTINNSAIHYRGITLSNVNNTLISGNEILGTPMGNINYAQAGIYISTGSTNTMIRGNNIHDFYFTGTTGYGNYGIYYSAESSSPTEIYNNTIYGIKADGDPSSTSFIPAGIYLNAGGNFQIYYNSINMTGATLSSTYLSYSSCISIASAITNVDMRDNVFKNSMMPVSGTGNKTFAIYTAAPSGAFANLDFNDYFVDGINPNVGYLAGNQATLSAWQAATGKDVHTIYGNPRFNSSIDLHLNLGSPALAAGTPLSGITTDFSGILRSASTPSMGAYENGVLDTGGPDIVYTALGNTISTTARSLYATITDFTWVPQIAPGLPVLYWKINSGPWNNVTAYCSAPSQYLFVFGAGVAAYDVVSYYIAAQDAVSPPNVSCAPDAGAAGFTAFPPAVSSPPATPSSYTILPSICGTYNVGVGGNYATLTAAVADLNAKTITCPAIFNLTDATYPSETYPIIINANTGSSTVNTLTIRPAPGINPVFSGSSATALIKFNGADYMTIDGFNNGGTTHNITFINTNTSANTAVIWLSSLGSGAGTTNITIKNCNIQNGINSVATNYGIFSGGTTIGSSGYDNDNCSFQNNNIKLAYAGICATGSATGVFDNLSVTDNTIGSNSQSEYVGHDGIKLSYISGGIIAGNTIYNLTSGQVPAGLTLSTGVVSSVISRNNIHHITYTGTGGFGGRGMYINTGSSSCNLSFTNNLISAIWGDGYSNFAAASPVGFYFDGINGGLNIYYNSVYLSGTLSYNAASLTTAMLFLTSTNTNIDLRNNIFMNEMTNTVNPGAKSYAIYSAAPASSFTQINYNDYFTKGSQGVLGFLGSDQVTLAGWRTATGKDSKSISGNPLFVRTSDLRLGLGSPALGAGTPLSGITTDYSGTTRNITTPSIGGYETGIDLPFPEITYTPFSNTSSTAARTLTTSIIDTLGIPASGIGLPVLYWRIGTGAWSSFIGVYSAPGIYSFTFGNGAVTGDIVSYYIVAQDLFTVPRLTCSPAAGSGGLTPNPPAAGTPPTVPNSYKIKPPIGGSVTVGTGGTFSSLTREGGLFAAINGSILNANVIATIISDLSEDGTYQLNQWDEEPVNSNFTLVIQPDGTTERLISGAIDGAMIHFQGADRVTIDGRFGGAGKYLRFRKSGDWNPTFIFSNDATGNTIRNCFIEGSNTGPDGVVNFSGTTGTTGNDNNVLTGNVIRDLSSSPGIPANLVFSQGTAGKENSGNSITDNEFLNFSNAGIFVTNVGNGNSWNISNNSFYNNLATPSSTDQYGIYFAPGSTSVLNTISGNYIGGQAPQCGGLPWRNTGSQITFCGIYVSAGTTAATGIQGNTVRNIAISTPGGGGFFGIYGWTTGMLNIGTSAPNVIGHPALADNILVSGAGSAVGIFLYNCDATIQNTTIANITQSSADSPGPFSGLEIIISGEHAVSINANRIFNCGPTSVSSGSANVNGIYFFGAASSSQPSTVSNNLISIGHGMTNNHVYTGIFDGGFSGNNLNMFFNSIYIGGTGNGSSNSYAFRKRNAVNETHYNNIYQNTRTGGTGYHYSIGCTNISGGFISDYNDLKTAGSPIGLWGTDNLPDLAAWQTITNHDANSFSLDPGFLSAVNLTPANMALSNVGIAVTGITKDFTGLTRSDPPDIGAIEFGVDPVVTTTAATTIGTGSAVLNGTINASALIVNSWFDYGTTTNYGSIIRGNPAVVNGSSVISVNTLILALSSNQLYHFRLRGVTSDGITVSGNDMNFTTLYSAYCIPSYTDGCSVGDGLNMCRLSDIDQEIPCSDVPSYYHDYTGLTTDIVRSVPTMLTIKAGYHGTHVRMWIDFNDNSIFETSEIVLSDFICTSENTIYSTSITIPAGSPPGIHRLRYRTNYNAVASDPCLLYQWGNGADFMVNILPSPVPPDVVTLDATGLTPTVAILNGTVNPNGHKTTATFN